MFPVAIIVQICNMVVFWILFGGIHPEEGNKPIDRINICIHRDWCHKGRGMYYPVCAMLHIKQLLLLIGKSSPCGCSGFPLLLSEWSFTICPTPYNRKIKCVECVVK